MVAHDNTVLQAGMMRSSSASSSSSECAASDAKEKKKAMIIPWANCDSSERSEWEVRWEERAETDSTEIIACDRGASSDSDFVESRNASFSSTAESFVAAGAPNEACLLEAPPDLTCLSPSKQDAPTAALIPDPSDPLATDLSHFHAIGSAALINSVRAVDDGPARQDNGSVGLSPLLIGSFVQVRYLAKAIHGDVYVYKGQRSAQDGGHASDDDFAVKRLLTGRISRNVGKETNERSMHLDPKNAPDPEDALTEIGVLSYLSGQADMPEYILRLLGIVGEKEHTLLVTEFAEGGELFGAVADAGSELSLHEVRRYTWELLQAVTYLHKHSIGHRDISLENLLLKGGQVRLMDFGMAVQSHSSSGTELRYFSRTGKDFYRAPECYVPTGSSIRAFAPLILPPLGVAMVACGPVLCEVKFPAGVQPGQVCEAELWGYAAQPADIFASAICLFVLAWQSPPWHRAVLTDHAFSFARSRGASGIPGLIANWQKRPVSPEAVQLLVEMLDSDPRRRPSAARCLASPWFRDMEAAEAVVGAVGGA